MNHFKPSIVKSTFPPFPIQCDIFIEVIDVLFILSLETKVQLSCLSSKQFITYAMTDKNIWAVSLYTIRHSMLFAIHNKAIASDHKPRFQSIQNDFDLRFPRYTCRSLGSFNYQSWNALLTIKFMSSCSQHIGQFSYQVLGILLKCFFRMGWQMCFYFICTTASRCG